MLVGLLVLSSVASFPATAAALSGVSSQGSAGAAQYLTAGEVGGRKESSRGQTLGNPAAGGEQPATVNSSEDGARTSGLPFTGFSLIALAGIAVLLISCGLALRSRSARSGAAT